MWVRISLFTRTLSFSNEKWVNSDWSNSSQMEYLPCYNWQEVSDGLELLSAVGKTSLLNTGTLTMTEKLRLVMFTSQNGVLCYATSKVIQTGDGSTVLEPPSLSQSREAWPTNRRPRIRPPVFWLPLRIQVTGMEIEWNSLAFSLISIDLSL